jgi:hypothetical protein
MIVCKDLNFIFKSIIVNNFFLMNKLKNFFYFYFKYIMMDILSFVRFEVFWIGYSPWSLDIFMYILVLLIVLLWFVLLIILPLYFL